MVKFPFVNQKIPYSFQISDILTVQQNWWSLFGAGTAIAASDGSYYPDDTVAACSWIVSTPDLSKFIEGGCILPGEYHDHNAYWAELGDQLGVAMFFNHLIPPPNINLSTY